ncbi:hypothetical protein AOQ84DRAFT_357951 [Glonium stellatum]|uniref:Uncharacterized protein n=1 Tax=Glonium stellatum TaxID=574774 RepID=A0A8E2JL91_9PEZI|nr:hypothetical protein AOQ84DRAFT_357951 [Glonium stellatum]
MPQSPLNFVFLSAPLQALEAGLTALNYVQSCVRRIRQSTPELVGPFVACPSTIFCEPKARGASQADQGPSEKRRPLS